MYCICILYVIICILYINYMYYLYIYYSHIQSKIVIMTIIYSCLCSICRYTTRLCKLELMKYGLFIRLFSIFVFATKCLGGYCCGVPPLPIPNREVKPACADGTAMQCGRVGRRPLYFEVSL